LNRDCQADPARSPDGVFHARRPCRAAKKRAIEEADNEIGPPYDGLSAELVFALGCSIRATENLENNYPGCHSSGRKMFRGQQRENLN
jgi:hypothetical protein